MKKSVLGKSLLLAAAAGHLQPLVHRPQQRDQPYGVEIEDRLGQAAKTGRGVIAGEGQDVMKSFRGITPGGRFQPAAIEVLAGQMDHDVRAAAGEFSGQPVGRKHRPAARIVGDRDPADARIIQQAAGKAHDILRTIVRERPAGGDDFGAVVEAAALQQVAKADIGLEVVIPGTFQASRRITP